MFTLFFSEGPVTDYTSAKTSDLIRLQLWGKEIVGKILAVRPLTESK
jgi:hypothetical protein